MSLDKIRCFATVKMDCSIWLCKTQDRTGLIPFAFSGLKNCLLIRPKIWLGFTFISTVWLQKQKWEPQKLFFFFSIPLLVLYVSSSFSPLNNGAFFIARSVIFSQRREKERERERERESECGKRKSDFCDIKNVWWDFFFLLLFHLVKYLDCSNPIHTELGADWENKKGGGNVHRIS